MVCCKESRYCALNVNSASTLEQHSICSAVQCSAVQCSAVHGHIGMFVGKISAGTVHRVNKLYK